MKALLVAAACLVATPLMAQDAARGAALFDRHCAVCHGTGLRGDGPMAEVLAVPPPDLTRIAERYDGFPRVGIAWKIDGRDPLVSHGGDMLLFGHVFGTMSEIDDGRLPDARDRAGKWWTSWPSWSVSRSETRFRPQADERSSGRLEGRTGEASQGSASVAEASATGLPVSSALSSARVKASERPSRITSARAMIAGPVPGRRNCVCRSVVAAGTNSPTIPASAMIIEVSASAAKRLTRDHCRPRAPAGR